MTERWQYYPPEPLSGGLERELGHMVRALQLGGVTVIGNARPEHVRTGDIIFSTGYQPRTGQVYFSLFRPHRR